MLRVESSFPALKTKNNPFTLTVLGEVLQNGDCVQYLISPAVIAVIISVHSIISGVTVCQEDLLENVDVVDTELN